MKMLEDLSKAERKALKAQAKLQKELGRLTVKDNTHHDRNAVCLKYGDKYSAEYVNRLYRMVKRHTTGDVGFYCMTENAKGLDPEIKIVPLPSSVQLQGWWYKPYVFSKDFPVTGKLLFLDLDIVIIDNIDCFWTTSPGRFCIIRDFTRAMNPNWNRYNSSVFRLDAKAMGYVWDNLVTNISVTKRLHGDQDWLYEQIKQDYNFWPDTWCQSYKWEVRNRNEIVGVGRQRNFATVAEPVINPETKILVFHGDPKPEQVKDSIVVDNWR
jgi:hypothetical protein